MAEMWLALKKTLQYEGTYNNDKIDLGSETYKGIARKFHPDWKGWLIIDKYKQDNILPGTAITLLELNQELQGLVNTFYKEEFWEHINGNSISNQIIAQLLFDTSVSMGISRAVRFFQEALKFYAPNRELEVDGKIGKQSLAVIEGLSIGQVRTVTRIFSVFRAAYYIDLVSRKPEQIKFLSGWLNRIFEGGL